MTPRLSYVAEWLVAFALTQVVEVPIYARALAPPLRGWKAFLPSALTHPVLWFAIAPRWTGSYAGLIAVGEAFAVVVEAGVLRALRVRRALAWSLLANAVSFLTGVALYAIRDAW